MKNTAGKIPRPLNSFMIYRLEKQKEILNQCPGANHREISKIVSKWWNEMSDIDKQPYVTKADLLKIEHRNKYPQYKFSPKKKQGNTRAYQRKAIHELSAIEIKKKERLISHFSKELTFDDVFYTHKTETEPIPDMYYYTTVPDMTDSYYTSFIPSDYSFYYGFYDPLFSSYMDK